MFSDMAADNPTVEPSVAQVQTAYENVRKNAVGLGRRPRHRLPHAHRVDRRGHAAAAPVWLYRFDHATPFLRLIGLGATHGSELAYLWGVFASGPKDPTFRLGGKRAGEAISARMQERWAAFAHGRTRRGGVTGAPLARLRSCRLPCDVGDRAPRQRRRRSGRRLRAAWGDQVLDFH
jgi:para-nitrobenzyl esterase